MRIYAQVVQVLGALLLMGLWGFLLGARFTEQQIPPPVACEPCAETQRMFRIRLSPGVEELLDARRGDRWVDLEAHPVKRNKPVAVATAKKEE